MVIHGCIKDLKAGCASQIPVMDMRRVIIRIRLRFPYGCLANTGPKSVTATRLVFWVQAKASPREGREGNYVNLASIGTPLDKRCNSTDWQMVEIKPSFNDWACLGARVRRPNVYTCNPASQVLRSVNVGAGLIYFPVDRDFIPRGILEIDSLEILHFASEQEHIYDERYQTGQFAPG